MYFNVSVYVGGDEPYGYCASDITVCFLTLFVCLYLDDEALVLQLVDSSSQHVAMMSVNDL